IRERQVRPAGRRDHRILKREGKVVGPFGVALRVGIEIGDDLAAGGLETGVPRGGEALVGQLDYGDRVAASRGHGVVRGAVVTIEDVERWVVAGYGGSKAAVEVALSVVAADDHGDPGPPEPEIRQPAPGPGGHRVEGELGGTVT